MPFPKIRLAHRIIIDNASTAAWDRFIYEDTYKEYLMQQQLFNTAGQQQPGTFRELLSVNPKAEQLHFLTGMAAGNYVSQLNGKFYRLTDVLGNTFFPFDNYRLDIINTDINDITRHKIGITLYSPVFTYLGLVNNCYLVSVNTTENTGHDTLMFPAQQLSICYYEGAQFNDLEKPDSI